MQKMIDPVCGMRVGQSGLRVQGHDSVAFCAEMCRDAFLADPASYIRLDETTRVDGDQSFDVDESSDPPETPR